MGDPASFLRGCHVAVPQDAVGILPTEKMTSHTADSSRSLSLSKLLSLKRGSLLTNRISAVEKLGCMLRPTQLRYEGVL